MDAPASASRNGRCVVAGDLLGQAVRRERSRSDVMQTIDAAELSRVYAEIEVHVAGQADAKDAFDGVTRVALTAVEGTSFASVTRRRASRFQTLAPTAAAATEADRLQYELGSGPCVDCVRTDASFASGDIGADARWPVFGPRVNAELGVASMLSVRLAAGVDVTASLNLYSRERQAFSVPTQALAELLAAYAGAVLGTVVARERLTQMEQALSRSRRIGMAVGVLMTAHRISSEDAFDLLRVVSQRSNRRVSAIAEDVIETGQLSPSD